MKLVKDDEIKNISILKNEHNNILRMISILEKDVVFFMNNNLNDINIFNEYIDFIKNYADNYHHGKEEKILFKYMTENLGSAAEKLVNNGMLVEHEFGRFFIRSLIENLKDYSINRTDSVKVKIIADVIGYCELLKRHIEKENEVVYKFAINNLSEDVLIKIEKETEIYEDKNSTVREKYENCLIRKTNY